MDLRRGAEPCLAGGSLTLAALLGFYAWIVAMLRGAPLSTPRLGMAAAATTLTIGAILGVLRRMQL